MYEGNNSFLKYVFGLSIIHIIRKGDFMMSESKTKIIGSIIIASILAVAMIISCFLGVKGLADYKQKKNNINIKGIATQQITSDRIEWSGDYCVFESNIKAGYAALEADKTKVRNYLVGKGFNEEDLIFSSISIKEINAIDENGYQTNEITGYELSQTVTIRSEEIDKVTQISRTSTDLILEDVQFQSYAPAYIYTKMDELKVTMLADATKDATNRAKNIAENANSKLGDLAHAHISSVKISPLYYSPIDYNGDYNYYYYTDNDTASLEKEVTVVVYCTFEID